MPSREYRTLDVPAWEAAVGSPAAKWKGRCHEIAILAIQSGIVKGFPAYGHYRGDVAEGSFFIGNDLNVLRHGWVRTPRNYVVDPTRWVFQNVEPYIYAERLRDAPDYDEGGNVLRAAMRSPCPKYETGGTAYWDQKIKPRLSPRLRDRLYGLIGDVDGLTNGRLMWLANHSPEEIGLDLVAEFYEKLRRLDHEIWVPTDNWKRVMVDRKRAA